MPPEKHINNIKGEILNLMRNIYLDEEMMKKMIVTMIQPWSLHEKKHLKKLERVQRVATTRTKGFAL